MVIYEPHCFAGSKTGRHEVTPGGDEARMASSDAEEFVNYSEYMEEVKSHGA